ncbi:hypothetical protein C3486_04085 [Streptomyces sp. Ru73]|uniref:hypothetical protein n=1 Tax=Streptomyces sp. Ru73 TaxID=2080748 RepID=UPI000CDE0D96|nr:hypothetical protein [Streptomyces sp. Ru73]POX42755.1 hypothetical protein C3486_04085 [Streptomyces sp. Ru73]
MGLDLTVCMADWERLREIRVEDRIEAMDDAIWPLGPDDEYYISSGAAKGWLWPPGGEAAWCAEYRFFSVTRSYSWHRCAGAAWADMRPLAESSLREDLDCFLSGLIWEDDPDGGLTATDAGGFFPSVGDSVGGLWRRSTLFVCPPEAVPDKARAWERATSRIEELRGPFAAECEGWAGRPESFEGFAALIGEWGAVTAEAARRGWGLVGLPS